MYNVSSYLDDHPGGRDVLMEVAGTDASADFDFVGHSSDAIKGLTNLEVGSLRGYVNSPNIWLNETSSFLTQSSALFLSGKQGS